ncbi:MAG: hypothetical protein IKR57_03885 [Bacilli bacterium]|nr:hypothetical protein [Bacilli bacterium]
MKKTGLFKIIMFILLGMVVATWIFSASYFSEGNLVELGMYNVGFVDFFSLVFGTFEFQYFIQIFMLLLAIGAFYGVLGKTGKYRAWVEKIANFNKGRELVFLISCAFIIAVITAVFDYQFILLLFFPLLISIILAMGYDKVTALIATFGSMLVGTIGNLIGYNTTGVISGLVGTELTDGIYFKLVLLLLSLVALFYYLYKAKRTKKSDKNEEVDMFIGEKISNRYSIVPIVTAFVLLFVLIVIGCTNWESTFEVNTFSELHTTLNEWSPKLPYLHITPDGFDTGTDKIAILAKLFGSTTTFGEWHFSEMTILLLVASLIIGLIYRVKGIFTAMGEGAKKMLKPALMVMLTYVVIYVAGNQMFYPTIASLILGITNKFSLLISTFVMIIGSVLHVDILYVANYVVPQLAAKDANPVLISLLAQSIYGVTMFIAPTSAFLVFGLTYLNVPYKEWIKKTWKLIVALFAITLVVLLVAKFVL